MPVVKLGPDYLDEEVFTLQKLLNRGGWAPHEVAMINRAIQDRAEFVRAGLTSYTSTYWTGRIQREIDDRTRLRWDFKNGWTLDRFANGYWNVAGVLGFNHVRPWLIEYLRENDMQRWESPAAYLEHKRKKADDVAMANAAANTNQLNNIIDKMSDKQVKEFIQVERALQTGDRVTLHGQSHVSFERMRKASERSPAPPRGKSINPGMHPFKYKRKAR